jgi:hypothetical protein
LPTANELLSCSSNTPSTLILIFAIIESEAAVIERVWPISHVRPSLFTAPVLILAALLFSSQLALTQFTQHGSGLVGTGAVGQAQQGDYVALSADGNTAVVGGPYDNGQVGAAWVFTRIGGVWTQQGSKLVGFGGVGQIRQGPAVALSGDGTTGIVGGLYDNSGVGAAWVFVQQVPSLQATPTSGPAPLAVVFTMWVQQGDTNVYSVDFGDKMSSKMDIRPSGIACTVNPPCYTGIASTSHTYTSPGTYTATLLNSAGTSVATVMIVVGGRPC